ncbi:MAG: hypothetical protein QM765_12760 [Myxococcales bacterium]
MSRLAAFAAVIFLAGCMGPQGENTATGSVKGVTFEDDEVYAVYNVKGNPILQDPLVILISNDPDACAHLEYGSTNAEQPFLKLEDGTHAPSIWVKTNDHTDILTDMRGVGDDLYARLDLGAPADSECADEPCEGKWLTASKGTLEINASSNPSDDTGWAAGSYYLTFQGEQLSGSFRARPCRDMKIAGCSTAGGSAIPALGLLALALLKRRARQ